MPTKTCFLITPIGEAGAPIRRHANGLLDTIRPLLIKNEFHVEVAHEIADAGSIQNQVIQRVINSDLVIANLSSLNPNVMYELAIRHAICKPVIVLAIQGTPLPFDISSEIAILFTDDLAGTKELTDNLEKAIEAAMSDSTIDNPIYRSQQLKVLQDIEQKDASNISALLLEHIESLSSRFTKLERLVQPLGLQNLSSQNLSGQNLGIVGALPIRANSTATLLTGSTENPFNIPSYKVKF